MDKSLETAGDINSKLEQGSEIVKETTPTGNNIGTIAKAVSKVTGVAGKVIDVFDRGKQITDAETLQDKVIQTAGAGGFFTGAALGTSIGVATGAAATIGIIALSNPVGWVATGIFTVLTVSGAAYGAYKGSSKGEEIAESLAEKIFNYWGGDDDNDPDQPNSGNVTPETDSDGPNGKTENTDKIDENVKKTYQTRRWAIITL